MLHLCPIYAIGLMVDEKHDTRTLYLTRQTLYSKRTLRYVVFSLNYIDIIPIKVVYVISFPGGIEGICLQFPLRHEESIIQRSRKLPTQGTVGLSKQ